MQCCTMYFPRLLKTYLLIIQVNRREVRLQMNGYHSDLNNFNTGSPPLHPLYLQQVTSMISPSSICVTPPHISYPRELPLLSLPLLQLCHNRFHQGVRLRSACPPANHLTLLINQELLKVPFYRLDAQQAWPFLLHPLVYGLGLITIDICLAKHRKGHTVVDLAEVLDLVV